MKKLIAICITLLITISTYPQSESLNDSRYIFPKRVFTEEYKRQKHKRYRGKITVIDKNNIKYGDKILTIPTLKEEYTLIFTSGLFHPEIIVGKGKAIVKSQSEINKMSDTQKVMYQMSRRDSIIIGYNFDELKLLNPNPQTKRFVFWLLTPGLGNTTECYFELYNPNATDKTPMQEFINGARLTFYHRGTIII